MSVATTEERAQVLAELFQALVKALGAAHLDDRERIVTLTRFLAIEFSQWGSLPREFLFKLLGEELDNAQLGDGSHRTERGTKLLELKQQVDVLLSSVPNTGDEASLYIPRIITHFFTRISVSWRGTPTFGVTYDMLQQVLDVMSRQSPRPPPSVPIRELAVRTQRSLQDILDALPQTSEGTEIIQNITIAMTEALRRSCSYPLRLQFSKRLLRALDLPIIELELKPTPDTVADITASTAKTPDPHNVN